MFFTCHAGDPVVYKLQMYDKMNDISAHIARLSISYTVGYYDDNKSDLRLFQ